MQKTPIARYWHVIQRAVQGGVTMVQLRDKTAAPQDVKRTALELQRLLQPLGVPFIINDHVALAAAIHADGVHIGQQDMDVASARAILGPRAIIGVSIDSMAALHAANLQPGISYVTASAVFPSRTKPDCRTIWGLHGLRSLVSQSAHPVTAIGGIHPGNAKDVWGTHVCGIAVVGAIHDAPDPCAAAQALIEGMAQDHHGTMGAIHASS